jgi:integrase
MDGELRSKKKRRQPDALRGERTTFNELTKWYLEQECVKNLKSFDIIKIRLNTFNSEFGNWRVNQITVVDLKNFQAKMKAGIDGKKWSPATINQTFKKAKTAVNLAYGAGKVSTDAFVAFHDKSFKPLRWNGERDRTLSLEEFSALVEHSGGHLLGILIMSFYTGMRRSEVMEMTWDRIHLEKRLIYLDPEHTKNEDRRSVDLHDDLLDLLETWPTKPQGQGSAQGQYVFTYKGKPIKGDIRDALKTACKKAGIPYGRFVRGGFILHDLRRTFVTLLSDAGQRDKVIMALSGHSTARMLRRYDRPTPERKRKAIDTLPSVRRSITKSIKSKEEEGPSEEGPSFTTA